MLQSATRISEHLSDGGPASDVLTVLRVVADTDHRTTPLDHHDGVSVETVAPPEAVPRHLGAADCVVSDGYTSTEALADLLATVREHDPRLPFVLVAADPSQTILDTLLDAPWTDCSGHAGDDPAAGLLVHRLQTLVDRRRLTEVARRSLAALEQGTEAVAIVDPDGTVAFANQLFARQFRASPSELVGRDWRELYVDDEVDRLESDALPSLADGWRWMGDCEARREDATTFRTQTRVDALEDDSLMFTLSEADVGSD